MGNRQLESIVVGVGSSGELLVRHRADSQERRSRVDIQCGAVLDRHRRPAGHRHCDKGAGIVGQDQFRLATIESSAERTPLGSYCRRSLYKFIENLIDTRANYRVCAQLK
jgi:hypothetical protein